MLRNKVVTIVRIYKAVPMGLFAQPRHFLPAAKAAGYNKVVPTGLFVIARITSEAFAEQTK